MLHFQPASECDIPTLRFLAERIWRDSYAGVISREQMDYMLGWMYSADTIRREMDNGVLWEIVRLATADIGYLSVTFQNDGVAKLNKLYLLAAHQRRGFGQEMLKRIFETAAARGATEVQLQVNKANLRAQRAYERFGFVKIDEAVFDIGGGFVMDDYILARKVGP